ncbi:PTS sugar transporter subunit IIB [Lactobacillus sp. ESL0791]|uniref:PTS system mannose/fructose/N-acetylgalactosamine-transporter subunit IIB n=1 Tax=Lactobacillus sp. ESL0791 TaxID=2983234 RepID=UPI0023F8EA50|nr:PTS sugar transporter subunit IIB [Lactobacillus sp. ESL0791]MDF7638084.1 PTS sugar transporter subunit IIB [Lactobacillus sp. ESL0791]
MIKEVRVDDRLIHGQIALTWPKALHVSHIVVANDKASANKMQQMTLKMAVPTGIKVLIRSVEDTISLFANEKAQQIDMMVIVSSVADANTLVKSLGKLISRVNIANSGRFDGIDNSKKKKLGSSLVLSEAELNAAKDIVASGINTVHQVVPEDQAKKFDDILKAAD